MYSRKLHSSARPLFLKVGRNSWRENKSRRASLETIEDRDTFGSVRMRGRLLYSPAVLNGRFSEDFKKAEWEESRTSYWVTEDYNLIRKTLHLPPDEQKREIEAAGLRPIFSYNKTDFVKKRVAVEIQFGKYSFIAYDLFVKHMAFYVGDAIDVGVEILPMKSMQEQMSSGPGYYEAALYDVVRQGRGVPAVPLVLVGIAP